MEPSFIVTVGHWAQLGEPAGAIRHQVFVIEQQVPLDLELDEHDAQALHALAREGGNAIGTGRLLADGRIGRMAVLPAYRGRGAGAQILKALIEQARQRGDASVTLAAQCHAQAFYRAYGFVAEGPVFMDAGIKHISMRRLL